MYATKELYNLNYELLNYFNLKKKNEELLKENRKLKELHLKSNSLALYPNAFGEKRRFPFKLKEANVIKNSFLNQRNNLIIDKGSVDGIKNEMGVISKNGIIGIVNSVSKNYSRVISILNQEIKINVRLKKNNALGSMYWKGLNPLEFKIEDVINNVSFKKGDTIISGGMSSYFPYGIPLGEVVDFESNSQNGYYTINARLFEDPSLVNYVYILTNEDKKEIKQLQENFKNE
tara:strand:+ start:122 stop:817 length:696 start_codon:yes stop_codon:yes gene_type:complete